MKVVALQTVIGNRSNGNRLDGEPLPVKGRMYEVLGERTDSYLDAQLLRVLKIWQ